MKFISHPIFRSFGPAAAALMLASCAAPSGNTDSAKRNDVHAMKDQTLRELASSKPESRGLLAHAAGYAVFNQVETKVLTAGSANGYGIAVDNMSGRETYMRMAGLSAGFGAGLMNSRTVIIFRKPSTYRQFITSGWSMAADAKAAGALDRSRAGAGLALTGKADPVVYHMTRSGVSVSATVGAKKVWADSSLNH